MPNVFAEEVLLFRTYNYEVTKKVPQRRLPKHEKKKRITVTIKKPVFHALEKVCKDYNKTRSEVIEGLLEKNLFRRKNYIKYRLKELRHQIAFWEYELKKEEVKSGDLHEVRKLDY